MHGAIAWSGCAAGLAELSAGGAAAGSGWRSVPGTQLGRRCRCPRQPSGARFPCGAGAVPRHGSGCGSHQGEEPTHALLQADSLRRSAHARQPCSSTLSSCSCDLHCDTTFATVYDLSCVRVQALTGVIQRSTAQTVMGLDAELQGAAAALQVGRTVMTAAASPADTR